METANIINLIVIVMTDEKRRRRRRSIFTPSGRVYSRQVASHYFHIFWRGRAREFFRWTNNKFRGQLLYIPYAAYRKMIAVKMMFVRFQGEVKKKFGAPVATCLVYSP